MDCPLKQNTLLGYLHNFLQVLVIVFCRRDFGMVQCLPGLPQITCVPCTGQASLAPLCQPLACSAHLLLFPSREGSSPACLECCLGPRQARVMAHQQGVASGRWNLPFLAAEDPPARLDVCRKGTGRQTLVPRRPAEARFLRRPGSC